MIDYNKKCTFEGIRSKYILTDSELEKAVTRDGDIDMNPTYRCTCMHCVTAGALKRVDPNWIENFISTSL